MCSFTRTNPLFSTEAHMAEGSKINLVPLCRTEQDVESLCWSTRGLQPFTLGTYAWRGSICTAVQTCYRGSGTALGRSQGCCCCSGLQPPPSECLEWVKVLPRTEDSFVGLTFFESRLHSLCVFRGDFLTLSSDPSIEKIKISILEMRPKASQEIIFMNEFWTSS